jgi:nucleoside 2-deoxyribosyltransferase
MPYRIKIAVAGPYSAPNESGRQENLNRLNFEAAKLLEAGHIPLIGVNAALPVISKAGPKDEYEAIMAISMAVIEQCDAIVVFAESPGALKEKEIFVKNGKPVFQSAEEAIRYYKEKSE